MHASGIETGLGAVRTYSCAPAQEHVLDAIRQTLSGCRRRDRQPRARGGRAIALHVGPGRNRRRSHDGGGRSGAKGCGSREGRQGRPPRRACGAQCGGHCGFGQIENGFFRKPFCPKPFFCLNLEEDEARIAKIAWGRAHVAAIRALGYVGGVVVGARARVPGRTWADPFSATLGKRAR